MKVRIVEDIQRYVALVVEAETDEERLLLRVFNGQGADLHITGMGIGGAPPGVRNLRIESKS